MNPFEPQPWMDDALCRQTGPDDAIWFPEKGGSPRAALDLCNGTDEKAPCPVRAECLEYALQHERWGVWGGLSERRRDKLRKGGAA